MITTETDAGKMLVEYSKIALNNKKMIPFNVHRKVDSVNWEIIFLNMISVKTPAENPTIKEKNIYPNSCIYHVKVGQEKMLIVMHKATY